MKEYWIDFSGYVKVEAENADEAERKFWNANSPFHVREGFSDDVWEIEAIEEVANKEDESTFKNPNAPTLRDIEDFWNDK